MFVKNDNRILQKLLRQTVLSNKAANVWQLRIHFNSSGGTLDEETAVIRQLSHNCLTKKNVQHNCQILPHLLIKLQSNQVFHL